MQSRHKATLGGRYVELYTSSKPVFDQVHARQTRLQHCPVSERPARRRGFRVNILPEVASTPALFAVTGEEEQRQDCRLPTEASRKDRPGAAGCASNSAAAAAAGRGTAGAGTWWTARHPGDAQAAGPAVQRGCGRHHRVAGRCSSPDVAVTQQYCRAPVNTALEPSVRNGNLPRRARLSRSLHAKQHASGHWLLLMQGSNWQTTA